jgi:hypothetical protein
MNWGASVACEDLQAQIAQLQAEWQETHDEAQGLPPSERQAYEKHMVQITLQIKQLAAQLQKCLQEHEPQQPIVAQPREILDIQYANPSPASRDIFVTTNDKDAYPIGADLEWAQVLAPDDEYDAQPVAATGWVIHPKYSSADVPFTHPFGFDWEFYLALDGPPGPDYTFLLAPANRVNADQLGRANELGLPPQESVLGLEIEDGLLPNDFRFNVQEGDRTAVVGRWIADTGHNHFDKGGYCSEIHPPLMLATARVVQVNHRATTRALFTSRPYLTGQTFCDSPDDDPYVDGQNDDGSLIDHLKSEVVEVEAFASSAVEAHPKIKSKPFEGVHLLHFVVRPPPRPPGFLDHPLNLQISFQFTVRSSCAVQVSSDGTSVDVFVALNGTAYQPPPLPPKQKVKWTLEQLQAMTPGDVVGAAEGAKWDWRFVVPHLLLDLGVGLLRAASIIQDGVWTSQYDLGQLLGTPLLDRSRAILDAAPTTIPPNKGIVRDDNQPYPVYGWLEAKWVPAGGVVIG